MNKRFLGVQFDLEIIQFWDKIVWTNVKKLIQMHQKKSWTPQEDQIIRKAVQQMGERPQWKVIAEKVNYLFIMTDMPNRRTAKQCRQRWHNKLDPHILDKQWDQDEINRLFQLHNEHGNKWSLIATMMNGRTDNCVKNKFYSALRKGMRKINKYIINLKRKLSVNKNVCIKEFKDVVLTKLIAVADKKYEDKLDVKENHKSKTENLSQAIKIALVQVSKNEDDYYGHVKKGVADGDYELEQNLFRNIQEFCRNCKRKKGKRKDEDQDQNESLSAALEESQIGAIKQIKMSQIIESKLSPKSSFPALNSEINSIKANQNNTINRLQKLNCLQINSTAQDLNQIHNSLLKTSFELLSSANFTKFAPENPKENCSFTHENRAQVVPNHQNQLRQNFTKTNAVSGTDFFQTIRSVTDPTVQYQKTDNNNKQPQTFKIQEILFRHYQPNQLENSCNNFSLTSSNVNLFGEKSMSMGFLGRSRSFQNPFDGNQGIVYISSSYSSSSNKQQDKLPEIIQMAQKNERADGGMGLQRSTQNFLFTSSLNIEEIDRRASTKQ